MHMSTKPRLASLHASSTREDLPKDHMHTSTCELVKKQALAKGHLHMSTKHRLASLYMQHLPHVKKQVLAQRLYAHVYKIQTSLSLRATSSTREEASSCLKIICTPLHVKKQALAQRSYAHVYKTQTSLSLRATSSTC